MYWRSKWYQNVLTTMVLTATACIDESSRPETVERNDGGLITPTVADDSDTSLKWNGIHWNGIHWNGIHWNGIHWNGVAWQALSSGEQRWHEVRTSSLIAGPLATAGNDPRFTEALLDASVRQLFGHIVECALAPGASLSYTDDAGADWTFSGIHGMAPEWRDTSSCDLSCQRTVSACMYARINYHGERNVVSWRSASGIPLNAHTTGMDDPSSDEDASFALDEGAVWGNLFLETPELWVCLGADSVANLTLPGVNLDIYSGQVPMGAIRMCAGDQDCLDNVYAGPCYAHPDAVCQTVQGSNGAYDSCTAPGGSTYTEVLTLYRADFSFHADFVTGAGLDPALSTCAADAANHGPTAGCVDDWDGQCVDYALGAGWGPLLEREGCNNGLVPPLGHGVHEVGENLSRSSSTCTAYVCAIDGACCDDVLRGWDADCAAMALSICQ